MTDKNKLIFALIGLALVVVAYRTFRRDPEIKAMHTAVLAATSWHADLAFSTRSGAAMSGQMDVVCPDRERTKVMGGLGAGGGGEVVRVGEHLWTDQFGGWTEMPDQHNSPLPCKLDGDQPLLAQSQAKAMAIVAELHRAYQEREDFKRGELRSINHEECRDWTVGERYTVCLSTESHLPLQFQSSDSLARADYSAWNTSIQIDPPK